MKTERKYIGQKHHQDENFPYFIGLLSQLNIVWTCKCHDLHADLLCGLQPGVNGLAAKPVPPPRDHLRIEKDGRLVNRAPAPQVPARTATAAATPLCHNNNTDPTKEQLDSIRKFQVSTTVNLEMGTRMNSTKSWSSACSVKSTYA
jgi:hypothetical protein